MSTPPEVAHSDMPYVAPQSEAVDEALRANLGLTQDADVNLVRLQQAAAFVAAVNAQYEQVASGHGLAGLWRSWVQWFEAVFSGGIAGGRLPAVALTLIVGVGVGVGLTLMAVQQGGSGSSEPAIAAARPAEPATLYRGDGRSNLIVSSEPKAAAARLVASLVSLGCGAISREVRATVYVEIDTTAAGCIGALPVIAMLGFAPEANGRLTVRFVPPEK